LEQLEIQVLLEELEDQDLKEIRVRLDHLVFMAFLATLVPVDHLVSLE